MELKDMFIGSSTGRRASGAACVSYSWVKCGRKQEGRKALVIAFPVAVLDEIRWREGDRMQAGLNGDDTISFSITNDLKYPKLSGKASNGASNRREIRFSKTPSEKIKQLFPDIGQLSPAKSVEATRDVITVKF